MGSDPARDPRAEADEQPQHQVELGAFFIGRTEVTNEQYEACVHAGACAPSTCADDPDYNGANYPVVGVDWDNARAYCQWAGGDLPTEARWEKAARGTDGRIYPWGNEFDEARANLCDVKCPLSWRDKSYYDGYERTAPTSDFWDGISSHGTLHMAGNVWEWVLDCYDGEFYETAAAGTTDPVSDARQCSTFVLRGGSWAEDRYDVRCANRHGAARDEKADNVGFRCVFPVPVP